MFRFILKMFLNGLAFLSCLISTTLLSCISIANKECKARPEIVNVNSNQPVFYPFSIKKVNVVGVVIILTIHMQKYVFLIF